MPRRTHQKGSRRVVNSPSYGLRGHLKASWRWYAFFWTPIVLFAVFLVAGVYYGSGPLKGLQAPYVRTFVADTITRGNGVTVGGHKVEISADGTSLSTGCGTQKLSVKSYQLQCGEVSLLLTCTHSVLSQAQQPTFSAPAVGSGSFSNGVPSANIPQPPNPMDSLGRQGQTSQGQVGVPAVPQPVVPNLSSPLDNQGLTSLGGAAVGQESVESKPQIQSCSLLVQ